MNAPAQIRTGAPTLDVRGLRTTFHLHAGQLRAVDDVSFSVGRGQIMGLVGESGSGKSITGFSIMRLIDRPGRIDGGEILFHGRDLLQISDRDMRQLRGTKIAMILQDPMMTLNPVLRVETQMIETILAHEKVSRREAWERSRDALGLVGIASPEERLRAYPHQFSGGMRQRVAIAIAMLHRPDLIIADEPTTALDVTIQAQILSEVQQLARNFDTSFVWITHDLSIIAGLADSIAVMYAGKIVESGTIDEVLDQPMHPYTMGLIDSIPSRSEGRRRLKQIPGMTPNMLNLPAGCPFRSRCAHATSVCQHTPRLTAPSPGRTLRCFHPLAEPVS
ncbi:ABC transporter ATP-binding protein [Roseitranquillus sediminis]|uniref:ABC transporter ATP-binding protein n=1 Tax=Roseitranquillus sediminis TaxID=2809051 RepID=UPI001D0CD209|nr:ABC transporter ATP-binding protein [Roseitranquillus sediminis]MBM9594719.1 ABC transporter ATP-binding protein [Roseitranquillus sediminis]